MDAPVEVGQVVAGKYAIERVLARGGVGVVVKAKHLRLLEPCAIKFMRPEVLGTPLSRERFLREARACARLKSDHVVRVFDVGELDAETPYMVLEYLDGMDLGAHLSQRGPLPVREAARYLLQICAALAEAHALGIVHRDLKPANVFLTQLADGTTRVKLLDFGISKVLHEPAGAEQAQTLAGTVMGTPSFMAPEQVRGDQVDARTDVWAVGVMLYQLLTGHLPFEGGVTTRILAEVLTREPQPPSDYLPTLPPALDQLILQCLHKDAAGRPASAAEIAVALAPFAEDQEAPRALRTSDASSRPQRMEARCPPAEPTLQTMEVPRPIPMRPGARWKVPAAIASLVVAAAVGAALAPRASGPARAPLVTAPAIAAFLPAEPTALPSTSDTAEQPPPAPAVPSSRLPPSASARIHAASSPRSSGFNLGSRH